MAKTKKTHKDEIIKLIRLVDSNKYILFKFYDVYRGTVFPMFIAFLAILFSAEILMTIGIYILRTINVVDFLVVTLTLLAILMAFLSLMASIGERNM